MQLESHSKQCVNLGSLSIVFLCSSLGIKSYLCCRMYDTCAVGEALEAFVPSDQLTISCEWRDSHRGAES